MSFDYNERIGLLNDRRWIRHGSWREEGTLKAASTPPSNRPSR